MLLNMVCHKLHTSFCFQNVVTLCSAIIIPAFNKIELHTSIRLSLITAWECHKLIFVYFLIGESNQMLMLTPVMPKKRPIRKHIGCFFQNGVINLILIFVIIIIVAIAGTRRKEIRRRQLSCITCNDRLISSENGTDSILRKYLRCFIKDDHIKMIILRIQEISHRKR